MLKAGTLLVALFFATSAIAQEAANRPQLDEPSLREQAILLEGSCDMNRTLLSYPETTPADRIKYEFALYFCLSTLRYNKQNQELSDKLEASEMKVSALEKENEALKRKSEPKVAAVKEQKPDDEEAKPKPLLDPGERIPMPRRGPARDSNKFPKQKHTVTIAAPKPLNNQYSASATNPMRTLLRYSN